MKSVFTLEERTPDQVIVKVNAVNDPLVIARHPYIDSKMAYITVTRGENHVFTVINHDGTTWSIEWGERGHTLISRSTELLKEKVVEYIERECQIMLEWDDGEVDGATIYYNPNFKKWQLTLEGTRKYHNYLRSAILSDTAKCKEDMMAFAEKFIVCNGWQYNKAVTGIDTWKAIEPKKK